MKKLLLTLAVIICIFTPLHALATEDNIDLFSLSLEELLNVKIVSVSKIEQKTSEAPATIRVITSDQIRQRGYQNLDEALKDIPGMDLTGVGGAYPYIHTIRGSFGDENRRLLLMVDGIVENSLNGGFEMAGAAYTLHNIERIEIIYGPASALYGANAYSGLINIITKQGKKNRGIEATVGRGSFDMKMSNLYLNFGTDDKSNNIDFSLAASWLDSRGEEYSNRHPNYSANFLDDGYSLVTRLSYQTESNKTTLGVHVYDMPMGIGTFGNSYTRFFNLPQASELNPGERGFVQHSFGGQESALWHSSFRTFYAQNDYQVSESFSLFTRLQFRKTGLKDDSYSYSSRSGEDFFNFIGQHESDGYGAEIQGIYDLGNGKSLTGGFQYNNNDLEKGYRELEIDSGVTMIDGLPILNANGSFQARKGVSTINKGYYLQYVFPTKLAGDTNFTVGIRYDENTLYGHSFTPRVGAVNKWNENLTFKLLYGQAFRAPTPFELFSASVARIENPKLEPETVDSYEFSSTYVKDDFQFIATLFYNDMDNVIVEGIPVQNTTKFQIQNIGTAQINGIEFEIIYFVRENLKFFANLTYQDANQNIGQGEVEIPNIAGIKGNINVDYQLNDNLNLNLTANWVGDRSVMPTNPLPEVDGYVIYNLTMTKSKFLVDDLSYQLKLTNLFDTEYEDPGIKAADGDQWGTIHEQPGRSVLFTLTYKM
jgi:outer membrane receptor for ferrienterochelin and colicin